MTIIQQPLAYNLSSMMRDFIISSTVSIKFEVFVNGNNILREVYTPDTNDMIYVRGRALGNTLQTYLYGNDLSIGLQENIAKDFSVTIDDVEISSYSVLFCNLFTRLPSENFFDGSVFLNLFELDKWTRPDAKEYLTSVLGLLQYHTITASVVYRSGNDFVETNQKTLITSTSGKFTTFDVSFYTVRSIFTEIDASSIVAYKLHSKNQISTYKVDRSNYLLPIQFIYKNGFDVPDSLVTRGEAVRKGATTYDTSKVNGITRKSNVNRADVFTVSSGKIYSSDEYDRYRDMFDSKDVRILFKGEYRKIVITEEGLNENLRKGNLNPLTFSFQFADERENNILLGDAFYAWILETGQWVDTNVWLDNGVWIDDPV